MICAACGHRSRGGAKFCARCGASVGTWQLGWFEGAWIAGLIVIFFLAVSPYLGPSPFVLGHWSGTPAVMPAGLSQTAGRFARLNLTAADPAGNLSGTLAVGGLSGPIVGKIHGRHVSLVVTSSVTGPAYYGMAFEGTVRGASIDGTLIEFGMSQWSREPVNYEVTLIPGDT